MSTDHSKQKLGTFEGVFTPTLLTILGVILYLRLGWVVGNVGLLGALIIIVLAHIISLSTTLSMSSMLTNIRIGGGGAYAIITRSLGLEAGAAIGIPFFLSQAISVAFYIVGFTEIWVSVFPTHSAYMVSIITWILLTIISAAGPRIAFRSQYIVLAAIVLSMLSFFFGPSLNQNGILWVGHMSQKSFWETFAIFFPAATGILAGASMSGELADPQKNIIRGTIAAVLTGMVVYIGVAYWFAHQANESLLLTDTSIILRLAFYKPLIIAGILGATFSSALSTMVGAPRTLAAMAENRVVPFAGHLAKMTLKGQPRNAMIISSCLSLGALLLGNLNSLATMLTMFFLAMYGSINLVVFIEQTIGIVSFRPQLKLSTIIPAIGVIGCIAVMFLINKLITVSALLVIGIIYSLLLKRNLVSPWGDVRGGIFVSLSEWAAQKAMSMPYHPKLWKPSILILLEDHQNFKSISRLIRNILFPSGRLISMTILNGHQNTEKELSSLEDVLIPLKEEKIFVNSIVINGSNFENGLSVALQTLKNTYLPPNTVFFTISNNKEKQAYLSRIMKDIIPVELGMMALYMHPKYGLGQERRINLWLRDRSPNLNLAALTALQLSRNLQGAHITLIRVIKEEKQVEQVATELHHFKTEARLPVNTESKVIVGHFAQAIDQEEADLTIIGMPVPYEQMFSLIEQIPSTVLFVADSGLESIVV
jgi:amino acid transporter